MKITKRQLKRIIREEKARLISETDYNSPIAIARDHVFQAAQALMSIQGAERMEIKGIDILIDQLLEALNQRL